MLPVTGHLHVGWLNIMSITLQVNGDKHLNGRDNDNKVIINKAIRQGNQRLTPTLGRN